MRFREILTNLSIATLVVMASTAVDAIASPNQSVRESTSQAREFRADIDQMATLIKSEHPQPFRFIEEAAFDALVEHQKSTITEDSGLRDVYWALSKVIASIGCGHSKPFYFVLEDQLIKPTERFPLDVRVVDNRLYVVDPLANAERVNAGDEILDINGQSIAALLDDAYSHIPTDNHFVAPKTNVFNAYATSYLTYSLGFPARYDVRILGQPDPVSLTALTEFQHQPIRNPKDPCQHNLCYRVDEEHNVAIMTIRSFAYYGSRADEFFNFVSSVFADLEQHEGRALLIDVRNNHGGSGIAASWLLRHLTKTPFTYWSENADTRAREELFEVQMPVEHTFRGRTAILMNAGTFSVVPHFLALASQHKMAVLMGTPAGGTVSTNDGKRKHKATASGFEYTVARMTFEVEAPSLDSALPIQPHIRISVTLDDVLQRQDGVLRTAIERTALLER